MLRFALCFIALVALAGCVSSPQRLRSYSSTATTGASSVDAARLIASSSSHQKVGQPYTVSGRRYVPERNDRYDETGIASWYGPNFHGRPTANGEVFDQNLMTAAHPTLPIPSIVEVTNLENGRQVILRLNDRGPFIDDRMIDLSRAAATELDYIGRGLARVRVRYLGAAHPRSAPPRAHHRTDGNETLHAARTGPSAPERSAAYASDDDQNGLQPFSAEPAPLAGSAPGSVAVPASITTPAMPQPSDYGRPDLSDRIETTELGELRDAEPISSRQTQLDLQQNASELLALQHRVTLQLGAFSDPANANRIAQRLSGVTEVRVVQGSANGRPVWRVFAGEFDSTQAAQSFRQNLGQFGIADSRIVPLS